MKERQEVVAILGDSLQAYQPKPSEYFQETFANCPGLFAPLFAIFHFRKLVNCNTYSKIFHKSFCSFSCQGLAYLFPSGFFQNFLNGFHDLQSRMYAKNGGFGRFYDLPVQNVSQFSQA